MHENAKNEIVQLHQFFQDWYNNKLENSDANFNRFSKVMAPEFTRVDPHGNVTTRDSLTQGLQNAHNSHRRMKIWIEDVELRIVVGDIVLATYEEWQEIDGKITCRLSSVVFREQSGTPNGLSWLHVHETWISC